MQSQKSQSNITTCYFQVLRLGKLTAREISQKSGVTEAIISKFRNGGDIYTSNYQKLLDALPEKLRNQYFFLLTENETLQISDNQLQLEVAERLEKSAYQLRQKRAQGN